MPSADSAHPIFVQPRFTGRRFDDHALPVDVASDLKAYQTLLVELAKYLFYQDNPDRQRVPKGFINAHLVIQGMEEGSTRPALGLVTAAVMAAGAMLSDVFDGKEYFVAARDLITECIAAPDSALPEKFPKHLLPRFNQIGRSLQLGEALELSMEGSTQKAVLNPEKRRRLVLLASAVYESEVLLDGYIGEVDYDKDTFRLRLDDNTTVTIPMTKDQSDYIRFSGGRVRDRVFIRGIATYDSHDHLQKIISVESLYVIKNFHMARRFDILGQLTNGWCRGSGIAPDKAKLEAVAEKLTEHYPEHLRLPTITPGMDGNLLLEWGILGHAGTTPCYAGGPWVNLYLDSMTAEFCVLDGEGNGAREKFDLGADGGIERFMEYLQGRIPQVTDDAPDDVSMLNALSFYTVTSEHLADTEADIPIEDVMQDYELAN